MCLLAGLVVSVMPNIRCNSRNVPEEESLLIDIDADDDATTSRPATDGRVRQYLLLGAQRCCTIPMQEPKPKTHN